MKQTNLKNQIWFEQNDGVVTVGFTKSFLDQLDQCWHVLPAHQQKFREKAPLMVVETNDALISIMSPINASFVQWEHKAQDFPDQLTEEDVILTMTTGRVERQAVRVMANELAGQPQWAAAPAPMGELRINVNNTAVRPDPARDALMRRIEQEQARVRAALRNDPEQF